MQKKQIEFRKGIFAMTFLAVTAFASVNLLGQSIKKSDSEIQEERNKVIVSKWLEGFWGPKYNAAIIDELASADMVLQYSLHKPRKGKADIKDFMKNFRDAFPDLAFDGAYPMLADGEYVIARWVGGGTQTGAAFSDWPIDRFLLIRDVRCVLRVQQYFV